MTTTTNGGCWCGKLRYEYSGTPTMKASCHCSECQKISGSAFTTNILVPLANFTMVSGASKQYSGAHQSGMTLTIHFCGDCGSTVYKTGTLDIFEGIAIVQGGTLDEGLSNAVPGVELFVKNRAAWLPELRDVGQMQMFS